MQRVKKVMAGIGSALMAGATLASPVFAQKTIGEAFGEMTTENTVVVVGANAAVSDVVAAIAIAAKLGQNGAQVSVSGGETRLEGVEEEDVELYGSPTTWNNLKDNDLAGLIDGTIEWNDETIDVEEVVKISNGLKVMSSEVDEDFGADVFLGTDALGAIEYNYVIDDPDFDGRLVSESEPLEVTILGRTLKIIKATEPGKITYESAIEKTLSVGDTINVEGKTVKVVAVGETAAEIEVDGQTEIITSVSKGGSAEEVGTTGIKVEVKDIIYNSNDPASSRVQLKVGSALKKTISDGSAAELFGEPEDATDAEWVWVISNTSWNDLTIGIKHNQKYDSDTEPVVPVGGSINLPDDYVKVEFKGLTVPEEDYVKVRAYFDDGIRVKYDENDNDISTLHDDEQGLVLEADKEVFRVKVNSDWEETDTIYILKGKPANQDVLYAFKTSDGDVKVFYNESGTLGTIEDVAWEAELIHDDTNYTLTFKRSDDFNSNMLRVLFGEAGASTGDEIEIDGVDLALKQLGNQSKDAEAAELTYKFSGTPTDIGTREKSVRTIYGTVIETPESNGNTDEVVLLVPNEQVKATIRVYGPASQVMTTDAEGSVTFPSVSASMAKLDTEVSSSDKNNYNLILVGGPAINALVAELADAGKTLSLDDWRTEYVNKAIVQVVEDAFASGKVALVVAGYEAEDTRRAAAKLLSGELDDRTAAVIPVDAPVEDLNMA